MRVSDTKQKPLHSSTQEAGPLMLQAFAWDMAPDASHWRYLAQHAQSIADLGVTIIWLPPAYKGNYGLNDVGYGVYDLYDLGEFDQKGTIPTKYGTKNEYLAAIDALHEAGIAVCADIVLNHRMGADASETVRATPINPHNRHEAIGEPEMIEAWTRFTFRVEREPTPTSLGLDVLPRPLTGTRRRGARDCGSSRASTGTSPSTRSSATSTT